ncbi:peptidase U32 family protein [Lentisphaerota bacterium WC36G]|nr:U32 family peptidase [Lentisphaerae bacterium WC36]
MKIKEVNYKKYIKQTPEVMAPAGSFESLSAALRSGANSVYFGVGDLNMRSRATANFAVSDLKKIVRMCHKYNAKAYLTLNIVVYDDELGEIHRLCDEAKKCNVDAIIASDIAVITYAKSIGLSVHISVQANVCNIESVKFYSQFAEVVVLARELTLQKIKDINDAICKQNITSPSGNLMRTEIFVHGALCVAVSGKCYMSLGIYNTSANRGACFQNCRRSYHVKDTETGEELIIDNKYVMSPKDICTIEVLDQLLIAGVGVLKIEGRGRSADYVGLTTKVYRQAVDDILNNEYTVEKSTQYVEDLRTVFNRDFWEGYYLGEKLGEWTGYSGNRAKKKKHLIGKITKFFTKIMVAEIELQSGDFKVGDQLLITGVTTGAEEFTVESIRKAGKDVSEAVKGDVISISVPVKVRKNDKVFRQDWFQFGDLDLK